MNGVILKKYAVLNNDLFLFLMCAVLITYYVQKIGMFSVQVVRVAESRFKRMPQERTANIQIFNKKNTLKFLIFIYSQ